MPNFRMLFEDEDWHAGLDVWERRGNSLEDLVQASLLKPDSISLILAVLGMDKDIAPQVEKRVAAILAEAPRRP